MTLIRTDMPSMIDKSEAIVYGKVLGTQVFYNDNLGMVQTRIQLQPVETFKSRTPSAGPIEFVIPGGVYNGEAWDGPGIPKIQTGMSGVFFLDDFRDVFWPFGLPMGVFEEKAGLQGQARLFNDLRDACVMDPQNPNPTPTEVKSAYYDLEGFKAYLRKEIESHVSTVLEQRGELQDLYAKATLVMVGRVVRAESRSDRERLAVTRVEIVPHQILKGSAGDTVVMEVDGGEAKDYKYVVMSQPQFVQNEDALIFLKDAPGGLQPMGPDSKVAVRKLADGRFEVFMEGGEFVSIDKLNLSGR